MKHLRSWLAAFAACATLGATAAVEAATYNIVGGFDGGQLGLVTFDITISADFTADITDTTDGLTIHALTARPEGGLGYGYRTANDSLRLGGLLPSVAAVNTLTTDFSLVIDNFRTAPEFVGIDSRAGTPSFGSLTTIFAKINEVDAPVPLPAALPMLAGALAGLAMMRRAAGPPFGQTGRRVHAMC
jgi:hypothetical protein